MMLTIPKGMAFAGVFGPPTNYPVGAIPLNVALADLNRDGKMDAVLTDFDNQISVLMGNGDGTFQPATNYPAGFLNAFLFGLAVRDFNEDGKLDIVAAVVFDGPGGIALLFGNGDGTFQPATYINLSDSVISIAVADFNHDHHLDLWTGNDVLLGNGDGTFQAPALYAVGADSVAVADMNNDQHPDLIASSYPSFVTVQLGNGDGTFQLPLTTSLMGLVGPSHTAAGDFDGDGKMDLAVTSRTSDAVSVLLGNGDGTFQPQITTFAGITPQGLQIADIDDNGTLDIVIADEGKTQKGGFVVVPGNGDGTFQFARSFISKGIRPSDLAIGKLNSDRKPDIVLANTGGKDASVVLNTSGH